MSQRARSERRRERKREKQAEGRTRRGGHTGGHTGHRDDRYSRYDDDSVTLYRLPSAAD